MDTSWIADVKIYHLSEVCQMVRIHVTDSLTDLMDSKSIWKLKIARYVQETGNTL